MAKEIRIIPAEGYALAYDFEWFTVVYAYTFGSDKTECWNMGLKRINLAVDKPRATRIAKFRRKDYRIVKVAMTIR